MPTANAFSYTGEQYDPNLDFCYLRARYYNPANGRFPTMDTYQGRIHEPQTLHKCMYVHADPVNNIDPSGLMSLMGMNISMSINIGTASFRIGGAQASRTIFRKVGCEILAASCDKAIDYGIYVFTDGFGNYYVGQSNDIDRRLKEHARDKSKKGFQVVARFLVGR